MVVNSYFLGKINSPDIQSGEVQLYTSPFFFLLFCETDPLMCHMLIGNFFLIKWCDPE